MSDPSRRAFLRGGFFRGLAGGETETPKPSEREVQTPVEAEPLAATEVEEPVVMPWERPKRRPSASDGPRRPAVVGTFQIATDKCLVYRGTVCSVCRERCPIPGCIELVDHRPVISSDLCDGCGLCVAGCPAPILAIRFVPPARTP